MLVSEYRKANKASRTNNLPILWGIIGAVTIALSLVGCRTFTGLQQSEENSFTIVLMPDTQNYTNSSFGGKPQYFFDQTEWIKKNKKKYNIVMVAHAGDIVQNPEEISEWEVADNAFKTIDQEVPYILCLGNHDITDDQGSKPEARDSLINKYFPPRRFTDNPVYSDSFGADPVTHFMEPGKSDNYYLYFRGAGTQFLIMALEFKPRNETLTWAGQVIEAHPDHRCVVLTHGYLNTNGSRGMGHYAIPGNQPEDIWETFISQHPTLFLVLCGHALGETVMTSTGKSGNKVQQILADYQNDYIGHGGHGYLRIMTFHPAKKEIVNQTYSPSLNAYLTRPKSQFTLEYE
jgi:hypothetical protein